MERVCGDGGPLSERRLPVPDREQHINGEGTAVFKGGLIEHFNSARYQFNIPHNRQLGKSSFGVHSRLCAAFPAYQRISSQSPESQRETC